MTRPGQGIFAPRACAPHYMARPLRSPVELREMSARLSILMVKNSRSFELTKIWHDCDKPCREFVAAAKARPLALPPCGNGRTNAHPEGLVVGEIGPELDVPPSTVSNHLDKLKNERLVSVRGKSTFFRYRDPPPTRLAHCSPS